jgi:hypothetical protein
MQGAFWKSFEEKTLPIWRYLETGSFLVAFWQNSKFGWMVFLLFYHCLKIPDPVFNSF